MLLSAIILTFSMPLSTIQELNTYDSSNAVFLSRPSYVICSFCPEPSERKKVQLPQVKAQRKEISKKPPEAVNPVPRPVAGVSSAPVIQKEIVYFDLNSSTLSTSEREKLDRLEKKSIVSVVGRTCEIGTQEYNDQLALRRAREVASYLKTGDAIVDAKGKCCYADENNRSLNRRVEIEYRADSISWVKDIVVPANSPSNRQSEGRIHEPGNTENHSSSEKK